MDPSVSAHRLSRIIQRLADPLILHFHISCFSFIGNCSASGRKPISVNSAASEGKEFTDTPNL